MEIEVERKDQKGTTHPPRKYNLTRIAFAKHFALAGQGYAPKLQKFIRTISMFFHYNYYIRRHAFNDNRFSKPPIQVSNPTENAQFSKLRSEQIAETSSCRLSA